MPAVADVTAVILAGGRATRMGGADKGLIVYRQRPLIEWVLDAIRPQVQDVFISANRNLEAYASYGCRVLPDKLPDYPGPLAGVLAAMETASTRWLLVSPCDTPHLPPELVQTLHDAAQAADAPMAVAADAAQTHYAVMLVQTKLADSMRQFLSSGGRALQHWQAPFNPARPIFAARGFVNINTPDDVLNR